MPGPGPGPPPARTPEPPANAPPHFLLRAKAIRDAKAASDQARLLADPRGCQALPGRGRAKTSTVAATSTTVPSLQPHAEDEGQPQQAEAVPLAERRGVFADMARRKQLRSSSATPHWPFRSATGGRPMASMMSMGCRHGGAKAEELAPSEELHAEEELAPSATAGGAVTVTAATWRRRPGAGGAVAARRGAGPAAKSRPGAGGALDLQPVPPKAALELPRPGRPKAALDLQPVPKAALESAFETEWKSVSKQYEERPNPHRVSKAALVAAAARPEKVRRRAEDEDSLLLRAEVERQTACAAARPIQSEAASEEDECSNEAPEEDEEGPQDPGGLLMPFNLRKCNEAPEEDEKEEAPGCRQWNSRAQVQRERMSRKRPLAASGTAAVGGPRCSFSARGRSRERLKRSRE